MTQALKRSGERKMKCPECDGKGFHENPANDKDGEYWNRCDLCKGRCTIHNSYPKWKLAGEECRAFRESRRWSFEDMSAAYSKIADMWQRPVRSAMLIERMEQGRSDPRVYESVCRYLASPQPVTS